MNICCSDCFNLKRDIFHRFIKKGIDRAYDDTGVENENNLSIFGILNDRVILFEWENSGNTI